MRPILLLSAKLRNKAVFFVRQHYFNKTGRNYSFDMFEHVKGKYLSYNTLYRYLYDMTDPNYFILPSTAAQSVLQSVADEMSSFKKLLNMKKQGNYDGKVYLPNYSDTKNDATYSVTFSKSNLSNKNLENGIINIPKTDVTFKTTIEPDKIH